MAPRKIRLVLAATVLGLCSLATFVSVSVAQQHGSARDQMELAQKKRLEAEADRLGMTPDQLRTLDTASLGTPLLYDHARKVTVAAIENAEHSTCVIRITPDQGSPETVSVDYRLGTSTGTGSVTYEGKNNASARAAIWQDLNADGVFDVLTIPVKHNDLLNLDQGTYILLDSKWMQATPVARDDLRAMKVADAIYRFDSASGRWQLGDK